MTESARTVFPNGLVVYRNANGKLHREDGPAVEWPSGTVEYWVNGQRHRTDGPAVEWNGYCEWWLNGEKVTEEEHAERVKEMQKDAS